jgi:uncharacterized membrane protein
MKAIGPPTKSAATAMTVAHPKAATRGVENPRKRPRVERRANRTLSGRGVLVGSVLTACSLTTRIRTASRFGCRVLGWSGSVGNRVKELQTVAASRHQLARHLRRRYPRLHRTRPDLQGLGQCRSYPFY